MVVTGTEHSGVMLMDGKEENSEGTVSVEALGELLFGVKTVKEICLEEGVSMSDRMKEEMKKIIPLSKIRLDEGCSRKQKRAEIFFRKSLEIPNASFKNESLY